MNRLASVETSRTSHGLRTVKESSFPTSASPRPHTDRHNVVAFVLQGRGNLAASRVGMLRALTEAGIAS